MRLLRLTGRWYPFLKFQVKRLFGLGTLPDYVIIGVQKAGTTTLQEQLCQHSMIFPPRAKELHFFDENWENGERWYRANFPAFKKDSVVGEATPFYAFHPLVPERMAKVVPDVKVILMVRDPVLRAFSHYNMSVRKGSEQRKFREAVLDELDKGVDGKLKKNDKEGNKKQKRHSYIARGRYAEQLKRWLKHFGRDQILVVALEDVSENPESELARIFAFLNLPSEKVELIHPRNTGKYKSEMAAETQDLLSNYFKSYNEEFFELVGREFPWL